jgi:hypothetical protein
MPRVCPTACGDRPQGGLDPGARVGLDGLAGNTGAGQPTAGGQGGTHLPPSAAGHTPEPGRPRGRDGVENGWRTRLAVGLHGRRGDRPSSGTGSVGPGRGAAGRTPSRAGSLCPRCNMRKSSNSDAPGKLHEKPGRSGRTGNRDCAHTDFHTIECICCSSATQFRPKAVFTDSRNLIL